MSLPAHSPPGNDSRLPGDFRRAFRRAGDPLRPQTFWIEEERAASGETVPIATIFLTNRECPWRCVYCDLWKHTLTESVPVGAIPAQIDHALSRLAESRMAGSPRGEGVGAVVVARQIKLYNSGSFFDLAAVPPEDHPAIAGQVRGFDRVIVECHPALADERVLRFRDLLPATVTLEVAMGLETAHAEVLAKLNKRMTLDDFARAAGLLRREGVSLRSFILVKPPFETDEAAALHWAERSVEFAFTCGSTVAVLIPVRGGNGIMEELARVGSFAPPKLATLEAALAFGIGLRAGRVFADLWDFEKFATCRACASRRRERLRRMNLRQELLDPVRCADCGGG